MKTNKQYIFKETTEISDGFLYMNLDRVINLCNLFQNIFILKTLNLIIFYFFLRRWQA